MCTLFVIPRSKEEFQAINHEHSSTIIPYGSWSVLSNKLKAKLGRIIAVFSTEILLQEPCVYTTQEISFGKCFF